MFRLAFVTLLLLSSAIPASAAIVIAGYNFNAADGVASTVGANATASNFTAGSGLNTVTFTTSITAREFNGSNYATAVANGDYFTFTATANAGYVLNLTDLTLREMGGTSRPSTFQINVNGTAVTPSLSTSSSFTGHTISLSSFTGLSSATIQIVAWSQGTGPAGQRNWSNDDVMLNGTVEAVAAVPEGSSFMVWGLMASLIGGLALVRRSTGQPAL
jgi:hypothetical protein